jgi:restriction system protein
MAVATWDQYMAPSLRVLADGEVQRSRQIITAAADLLGITDERRRILIPSGQEQYVNRGSWAMPRLARAGAVARATTRGVRRCPAMR